MGIVTICPCGKLHGMRSHWSSEPMDSSPSNQGPKVRLVSLAVGMPRPSAYSHAVDSRPGAMDVHLRVLRARLSFWHCGDGGVPSGKAVTLPRSRGRQVYVPVHLRSRKDRCGFCESTENRIKDVSAALAWSMKAWYGLVRLALLARREILRTEFKPFCSASSECRARSCRQAGVSCLTFSIAANSRRHFSRHLSTSGSSSFLEMLAPTDDSILFTCPIASTQLGVRVRSRHTHLAAHRSGFRPLLHPCKDFVFDPGSGVLPYPASLRESPFSFHAPDCSSTKGHQVFQFLESDIFHSYHLNMKVRFRVTPGAVTCSE